MHRQKEQLELQDSIRASTKMTDTRSMSARESVAGSASLFAELRDDRLEEVEPPGNEALRSMTKIVTDEITDQFNTVQKTSEQALGLSKEKQLTDYAMLSRGIPDALKAGIVAHFLKSHEINATTEVEADKLDYRIKAYGEIPAAHVVLLEEIFREVETHLQVQVETEVNRLAEGAKAIIQALS